MHVAAFRDPHGRDAAPERACANDGVGTPLGARWQNVRHVARGEQSALGAAWCAGLKKGIARVAENAGDAFDELLACDEPVAINPTGTQRQPQSDDIGARTRVFLGQDNREEYCESLNQW